MIGHTQFGYHIDTYFYCQKKPEDVELTYIGKSRNAAEIPCKNVNIITIPYRKYISGKILSTIHYWKTIYTEVSSHEYDLIFIRFSPLCALFQICFPSVLFVMDIRTASVHPSAFKRFLEDKILQLNGFFFRHISVISQGLAEKLKISPGKTFILPLGAESQEITPRNFDALHLLYVGTFYERKIENTLTGLKAFITRNHDIPIDYELVGDTVGNEYLLDLAQDPILKNKVHFAGYVTHDQLLPYWEKGNLGISFVPITEKFDFQPPTKTYEYIAAGMPCIATATQENQHVINDINGVLCEDNPESFCSALEAVWHNRQKYQSEKIIASLGDYCWEKICNDLYSYFRRLIPSQRK